VFPAPDPALGCHYDYEGDWTTPVVIDLDKDGIPEILINDYTIHVPGTLAQAHVIALDSKTCMPRWTAQVPIHTELAAADLDGDGFPEIVGLADDIASAPMPGYPPASDRLVVLDHNGNLIAQSAVSQEAGLKVASLIVNVDGMGPPEIFVDGRLYRFQPGPPPTVTLAWNRQMLIPDPGANNGPGVQYDLVINSAPVAADLDGDGLPELIDQYKVLNGITGADRTPPGFLPGGAPCPGQVSCEPRFIPATADFNGDGTPDIVMVTDAGIRVYDFRNRAALATYPLMPDYTNPYGGGAPVVGDFDCDGVPDFAVSDTSWFTAYALKCFRNPSPAGCKEYGILWQIRVQDISSAEVSAAAFDLDGDGKLEIVTRDELFLRILSAADGRTLYEQSMTSGTAIEYPVVADANGDGHADIVVLSDLAQKNVGVGSTPDPNTGAPFTGWTQGLFVLSSPRWEPARRLWNQFSYHETNINDNLSVPLHEAKRNVEHAPLSATTTAGACVPPPPRPPPPTPPPPALVDLTAQLGPPMCSSSAASFQGAVCNRGTATQSSPVPATFYDGPPGAATRLCTAQAGAPIAPGQCIPVSCRASGSVPAMFDLYLRVGDDGTGSSVAGQCNTANDTAVLRGARCDMQVPR
jgi:hypothetical protein